MRHTLGASWVGQAVVHTDLLEGGTRTGGWTHKEALELEERLVSQVVDEVQREMDAYCYRLLLISPFRFDFDGFDGFKERRFANVSRSETDGFVGQKRVIVEGRMRKKRKMRGRGGGLGRVAIYKERCM